MRWDVYRFTKEPRAMDLIGHVEAEHQPAARKAAAERWPDLAKQSFPDYPNARISVRLSAPSTPVPATGSTSSATLVR